MTTRVAFVGFTGIRDHFDTLRTAMSGEGTEQNVIFTAWRGEWPVALMNAARTLVTEEGGAITSEASVLYLAKGMPDDATFAAMRLQTAGVDTRLGWAEFDTDFADDQDAVLTWLADGDWPEPPPVEVVDPIAALLGLTSAPAEVEEAEEVDPIAELLGLTDITSDDDDDDSRRDATPAAPALEMPLPVEDETDEEPLDFLADTVEVKDKANTEAPEADAALPESEPALETVAMSAPTDDDDDPLGFLGMPFSDMADELVYSTDTDPAVTEPLNPAFALTPPVLESVDEASPLPSEEAPAAAERDDRAPFVERDDDFAESDGDDFPQLDFLADDPEPAQVTPAAAPVNEAPITPSFAEILAGPELALEHNEEDDDLFALPEPEPVTEPAGEPAPPTGSPVMLQPPVSSGSDALAFSSSPAPRGGIEMPRAATSSSRVAVAEMDSPLAMSPDSSPLPAALILLDSADEYDDEDFSLDFAPLVPPTLVAQPEEEFLVAAATTNFLADETTPQGEGEFWYISGSQGGAGKTTFAWLAARTFAHCFRAAGIDKKVFLLETDFGNPKLHQRLKLNRGNDSGTFAAHLESVNRVLNSSPPAARQRAEEKAFWESVYTDPSTGLNYIAAPYDITARNADSIRLAIEKMASYILGSGGLLIADTHTLVAAEDNELDRHLAPRATRIVVVTDAPKLVLTGPEAGTYRGGHLQDAMRTVKSLKTPIAAKGFGVHEKTISLIFNRTEESEYLASVERGDAAPYQVAGYVPRSEILENDWVGAMGAGPESTRIITLAAGILNTISPRPELESLMALQTQEPQPEKKKSRGFFGLGKH